MRSEGPKKIKIAWKREKTTGKVGFWEVIFAREARQKIWRYSKTQKKSTGWMWVSLWISSQDS